jgi:ribosomal protein S18 acetylase RimI-like enzyme
MEKRIIVRRLQVDDVARVSTLLADAFYSDDGWLGWASPLFKLGLYQDLKTRALAQAPRYACLVGFQTVRQGEVVIVGTVEISARPLLSWSLMGQSVPYVSNLAVAKSFRRQGIGQHLLLACEQVARTWGFKEIYLHVKAENRTARSLYHRVGYQRYSMDLPLWVKWLGSPQELLLHKALKHENPNNIESLNTKNLKIEDLKTKNSSW